MALRQREPQPMTVEAFEALLVLPQNRDRTLELVEGQAVEKIRTEEYGWIVAVLTTLLMNYVRERKMGRVLVETRYRSPDDPHNSRIPDVSYRQSSEPTAEHEAILTERDILTGGDLLPDFSVPVRDIFTDNATAAE